MDHIIGIRDPSLPFVSIRKLLEKFPNQVMPTEELSDSDCDIIWRALGDHAAWLEGKYALVWYEWNSDLPQMIGGVARDRTIRLPDQDEIEEIWRKVSAFDLVIAEMTDDLFEDFGRKVLTWYGISNPFVSRRSGDGGIDFVGEGYLGEIVRRDQRNWTVLDACRVLFVGQAKRYSSSVVGTPELRELVGSVSLLHRESYRTKHGYESLNWTLMQPKVLLLITTNRFSRDAIELAESSGIIIADRDQLCKMYALSPIL